jgi:transcriptional regulator with XRE-family HTH domain
MEVSLGIDTNQEAVAVPNRLRELREQRKLTRRELSIRLGVTESTIERWEMSKTRIPDERKLDIAKVLDVTPSELMGWD